MWMMVGFGLGAPVFRFAGFRRNEGMTTAFLAKLQSFFASPKKKIHESRSL